METLLLIMAMGFAILLAWKILDPNKSVQEDDLHPENDEKLNENRDIESRFQNVFFNITKSRRQELLHKYMAKFNCDEVSAMRHAIEDWEKDNSLN